MILYSAISVAEWEDIQSIGAFRPGYPSYQGKWVMLRLDDVAEMGRLIYAFDQCPFHIVEIDILGNDMSDVFFDAFRDRVGPAYYFDEHQLNRLLYLREVEAIPVSLP